LCYSYSAHSEKVMHSLFRPAVTSVCGQKSFRDPLAFERGEDFHAGLQKPTADRVLAGPVPPIAALSARMQLAYPSRAMFFRRPRRRGLSRPSRSSEYLTASRGERSRYHRWESRYGIWHMAWHGRVVGKTIRIAQAGSSDPSLTLCSREPLGNFLICSAFSL
jgi:hypothetical protein